MRLSNRPPKPSERARVAAEAAQEAALASLSHATTLVIHHDESEKTAEATRQALHLHRAGRSRHVEVPKDSFWPVHYGLGGNAPAAADATAGGPTPQPTLTSHTTSHSGASGADTTKLKK